MPSNRRSSRRRRRSSFNFGKLFLLVLLCVILAGGGYYFINSRDNSTQPMLMKYSLKENDKYTIDLSTSDYDYDLIGTNLIADTNSSERDRSISALAAVIYNVTDNSVVYSHNAYEKLYPASVTKLTTLLVALKYADLTDNVTITSEMLSNLEPGSSLCGIKVGDTISMNDLLYGLMLPSGNDAACAIAYHIGGNEEGFAKLMNEEAYRLGTIKTHYVNPHGLHNENHYTTAYDIYLIFNELLNYDKFHEIIGVQTYTATYTNGNGELIQNMWGRGIWYFNDLAYPPAGITPLGGKTGTTPEAKYCLSLLSSDSSDKKYISVILHADSRNLLYENMTNLLSKINN